MHDLKIGRLELFWWIDFEDWGVGVSARRQPFGVEAGFQIGPLNVGALIVGRE